MKNLIANAKFSIKKKQQLIWHTMYVVSCQVAGILRELRDFERSNCALVWFIYYTKVQTCIFLYTTTTKVAATTTTKVATCNTAQTFQRLTVLKSS